MRGGSTYSALVDTAAFDYDLPPERIAQTPVEPRDAARLLVDRGPCCAPDHARVADLARFFGPGDVVVLNETRVLAARLALVRASGGAVEVLLLAPRGDRRWEALARPSRRLRPGETLLDPESRPTVQLVESLGEGRWAVDLVGIEPAEELLARVGQVPLPPYITVPLADAERYQTVYARQPGSVAAPTAGLHLTGAVLDGLRRAGASVVMLDLAVGLGTFRPIVAERVEDHHMHAETYSIPEATVEAVRAAERVCAVGTTSLRALESWAASGEPAGETSLYLRRGSPIRVVDRLLTNFHVPRSSLLVLVDAFVGDRWRDLYAEALAGGYRFLSFGDAMLLERST